MDQIVFIDTEIEALTGRILDIGAVREGGSEFRKNSASELTAFLKGARYVCGHNIIRHDLKYLGGVIKDAGVEKVIDTLTLSPLLFPTKPYHALVKDDKLQTDDINNPLSDAIKARDLFYDEVAAFEDLEPVSKGIYFGLLKEQKEFASFFHYLGLKSQKSSHPYLDLKSIMAALKTSDQNNRPI